MKTSEEWIALRTPEQQALRDYADQIRPDWQNFSCQRHPEVSLVRTMDPTRLYCYLCRHSFTFGQLVAKRRLPEDSLEAVANTP